MKDFLAILGVIVLVLGMAAFFAGIGAFVLMCAWNIVVPVLFNGPLLGFWQAVGILVLVSITGSAFRSKVTVTKK